MPRTTDGTPRDSVDPATAWEGVFAEAKGFDDMLANSADDAGSAGTASDPGSAASQGTDDGSSSGASDTGSPLAPRTDATGDDGTATHASQVVDPARDPAAPAAPTTDATKAPDADPLAGTEPFTYTVGDETKTMDGVFRVPGEGLYVPEDKVPHFQLIASRAETLDRQNRELYDKAQEWDRRSTWIVRDAQGKQQTLTGAAAFEARQLNHATALAQLKLYDTLFKDPNRLAELLVANQDEQGNIVSFALNDREMRNLANERNLSVKLAQDSARAHLAKISAPPPPPEPDIASFAAPTISALVQQHKIAGLTPDDIAFYTEDFPRYIVTGPKGERMVDPRFLTALQRTAAMRGEQKKAADAAATTGKFNGGMNQGRKGPPAAVAPKPVPSAAPAQGHPNAGIPKPRTTKTANDIWSELAAEAVQLAG